MLGRGAELFFFTGFFWVMGDALGIFLWLWRRFKVLGMDISMDLFCIFILGGRVTRG